jgi:hypothetical protein
VRPAEQGPRGFDERRDVAPVKLDSAAIGSIDSADQIQQGRFTRTTATNDCHRGARLDPGIGVVENAMNAPALVKAAG